MLRSVSSIVLPGVLWGCLLGTARPALAASAEEGSATRAAIALAEGIWALADGADEEAVERFREAAAADPGDGLARFGLARALLGRGETSAALAAIEEGLAARRPSRRDPRRALAARAAAQLAAGDAAAAGASLEEALAVADDVAAAGRRPPWEGSLAATVGADSNPHLLSEELALPLPGGPPRRLVRGEEGDSVSGLRAVLAWHPVERPKGWNVGLSLDAGQTVHGDFSELDLGRARAAVHLSRGSDPMGSLSGPLGTTRVALGPRRPALLLQAGAARYWLGGAGFLETWDGAVAWTVRASPAAATAVELLWSERDFAAQELGDPRRSGRDAVLRLGQTVWFGRPPERRLPDDSGAPPRGRRGIGRPRLRLSVMAADRDAGREFTARALEGAAELSLPLGLSWTAGVEGAVRRDDFDHPESNLFVFDGAPREDDTLRAAATLSRRAGPRLLWTARLAWTDRESSVDLGPALPDLDYRRTTASLGARWAF